MREFKSDFFTPIGTGLVGPFSGAVPTAELPPLPAAGQTVVPGTYEEFTICDSGTPATRWWQTWTSDPS